MKLKSLKNQVESNIASDEGIELIDPKLTSTIKELKSVQFVTENDRLHTDQYMIASEPNEQLRHTGRKPFEFQGDEIMEEIELEQLDQEEQGGKQSNNNTCLEDGRITKFYSERLMNFEYTLLFFSLTNMIFTVIYYDSDFKFNNANDAYSNESVTTGTLWVILYSSVMQILITVLRYMASLQLAKKQLLVSENDTLRSTGDLLSLFIECFIIALQPYPFINDIGITTFDYKDLVTFEFKLNYLLSLLSLSKVFIICRVLLKQTFFLNPRAQRLCKMYGCDSNYQYAIKCLFQDYPINLITIVFLMSVVIWAFGLRICERPLSIVIEGNSMDFNFFENSIWLIIITMTTVGYGDFYPRTFFGRLLDTFIAIWGIFIISMMVVVLSNTLKLDSSEKRALTVLQRLETRKELINNAANLLTGIAKYKFIEQRMKQNGIVPNGSYFIDKSIKIKRYTDDFRAVNRLMKILYDKDDIYEEMARQFDFIKEDMKGLTEAQDKLCKIINENFNLGLTKK